MLQRLLLLLAAALFYSFQVRAQVFEPGLVVRANGDTLRGEIENGAWVEPPAFIRFRSTAETPSTLFQPRQLRAVILKAGRYFRYEALPIDHAANNQLAGIKSSAPPSDVRVDSLLAEVLLEGPVMLWRVVRPGSAHYLVRRPGQPVLDMAERRVVRQSANSSRLLMDANNYQSQLSLYFADCPTATATAEKAPYTAAGVAAVVQAYYTACLPAPTAMRSWVNQATLRQHMALQGGIVAGLRYNHFQDEFDGLPQTQGCVDCQPRPFAGLYTDWFLPNRTSAIYGELSLSTFNNRSVSYYQVNSLVAYSMVSYRAWLASARLGLRAFFPLPHEQQWLLSVSYELNKPFHSTVTSVVGNLTAPSSYEFSYGLPSLLPNLGLGWRTRHLTLSLDGQLFINPNGDNAFSRLIGTNYAARVGVAYRLGRTPDMKKPSAAHQ